MNDRKVIRVRDVMNDRYILVDGLETVAAAFSELKRKEAQYIIVEKRTEGDEFGMVLLSDIAKKVIAADRSPERVNVYEVMSKPVIAVRPEMDIRYTARLFSQFGLAVAPVIDRDSVVGVVTYADIVLRGMSAQD